MAVLWRYIRLDVHTAIIQMIDCKANSIQSRVPLSAQTRLWQSPKPLALEHDGQLLPFELAYRTWGQLNAAGDNAILVVHALSGSADLESWWPDLLGEGKPLDPNRDFVVCINLLGSCYGSSGPLTTERGTDRLWQNRFPEISVRDQARAQLELLHSLGVRRLRSVIGPSLGGMVALELAVLEPALVGSLILIGTTARHSAQAIANGSCQRAAIRLDPAYNGGNYPPEQQPRAGLALARQMAFVGYRSEREFSERFDRQAGESEDFAVQDYLAHQGRKFVERFDANSYLRLSRCMNSHDLGRGRGGVHTALNAITQPALVISLEGDQLYSFAEQAQLAEHLPNAAHELIPTRYGHDGFLIETDAVATILQRFLNTTH